MVDFKVLRGRVVVNDVHVVIDDHPNVIVVEVDLVSKYPDHVFTATDDHTVSVYINDGPNTLCIDDTTIAPTVVKFLLSDASKWYAIVDGSRYTVRVCLYRKKAH